MKIRIENIKIPDTLKDGGLIAVDIEGKFAGYGLLVTRTENGVILNLGDASIQALYGDTGKYYTLSP